MTLTGGAWMTETRRYLSQRELVQYLNHRVTIRTLRRWRRRGKGPPWVRIGGRVFYRIDEVQEWERRAQYAEKNRDDFRGAAHDTGDS
jgi:hypothetical protein